MCLLVSGEQGNIGAVQVPPPHYPDLGYGVLRSSALPRHGWYLNWRMLGRLTCLYGEAYDSVSAQVTISLSLNAQYAHIYIRTHMLYRQRFCVFRFSFFFVHAVKTTFCWYEIQIHCSWFSNSTRRAQVGRSISLPCGRRGDFAERLRR